VAGTHYVVIDTEGCSLYSHPTQQALVLTHLAAGTVIRVSSDKVDESLSPTPSARQVCVCVCVCVCV
jgi:hypothetical protein